MSIRIALAGNPNCGKTTLFNELTGSSEYVGNWSGVTVEKKEGYLKNNKNVIIEDLPGIYSLSPYSPEEIVSREYLVNEKPDVILNVVDGTNIERNLYLTTELLEIGLPVVIGINMMDIIKKEGDSIDIPRLSSLLRCKVIEISALKGEGINTLIEVVLNSLKEKQNIKLPHVFTGSVEHAIAHIEESIQDKVCEKNIRWYSIKIFERDKIAYKNLNLSGDELLHIEEHIIDCEKENNDTSENIIINQRYEYISKIVKESVVKRKQKNEISIQDKIDKVLTNRFFAIPIFIFIIFFIYAVVMGPIGSFLTNWTNEILFNKIIYNLVSNFLNLINCNAIIKKLVLDGIILGVGTVLGFVLQMALLFVFISILEDSGYMARIAFVFNKLFRKFGLSGKAFIPMIVGTGCGVSAIMASRTIEDEKDRKMTIMLSTFMPCSAKMEVVLFITQIFFNGNSFIATLMYFLSILIIILSGIALKKLNYFKGNISPFVMELPKYHIPSFKGVFIHVFERVKGFILKAGTVIFITCVLLWILMNFNYKFEMVDINESILKQIGQALSFLFVPLGFGNWQATVATISAEFAKEQAVATLSLIGGMTENTNNLNLIIENVFNGQVLSGFSFMIFNIFSTPCMVAVFTAFKEQGNFKWGLITFLFQMFVGYSLAFIIYQFGMFIMIGNISIYFLFAVGLFLFILFMIFRPVKK